MQRLRHLFPCALSPRAHYVDGQPAGPQQAPSRPRLGGVKAGQHRRGDVFEPQPVRPREKAMSVAHIEDAARARPQPKRAFSEHHPHWEGSWHTPRIPPS